MGARAGPRAPGQHGSCPRGAGVYRLTSSGAQPHPDAARAQPAPAPRGPGAARWLVRIAQHPRGRARPGGAGPDAAGPEANGPAANGPRAVQPRRSIPRPAGIRPGKEGGPPVRPAFGRGGGRPVRPVPAPGDACRPAAGPAHPDRAGGLGPRSGPVRSAQAPRPRGQLPPQRVRGRPRGRASCGCRSKRAPRNACGGPTEGVRG